MVWMVLINTLTNYVLKSSVSYIQCFPSQQPRQKLFKMKIFKCWYYCHVSYDLKKKKLLKTVVFNLETTHLGLWGYLGVSEKLIFTDNFKIIFFFKEAGGLK